MTVTDGGSAASPAAGRFPGWRVVAATFVVLSTSSGLGFYGLAVYLNTFSRERGWPVASISLATTFFFLVAGLFGIVVARLIARFDARAVIVGGGVLGAAALAMLGLVEQRWQLYLVYGCFAIGWSAAGLVPATTVVTRWFHAKRSVALSVASTGLSAGGIVITPFVKWLLDERGMATGAPWLALIWIVGIVPITLLVLRPDPVALGWLPDGERHAPDRPAVVITGTPFAEAVRSRFFRGITAAYVLALGAQVGAIQQLVKLMEERTDKSAAALATLVLAGMSVVARLVGGRVVHRAPMARLTASLMFVQGVSLALVAQFDGELGLFASIVLFGATVGNILMLQPLLVAERFGVRDYARVFSRTQAISVIGTAGGPLLLGWLHDHAGGYATSYTVAAACSTVGAFVLASSGSASPASADSMAGAPAVTAPPAAGARRTRRS